MERGEKRVEHHEVDQSAHLVQMAEQYQELVSIPRWLEQTEHQALVAFDLETTGTDPYTDRVVELAMVRTEVGGEESHLHTLVNPGVPIPEGATAVHGITDEQVADAPTFATVAPQLEPMLERAVLMGYNSRRFDTPLLHQELLRVGREGLPVDELGRIVVPEVDLYRVWAALEPRTLEAAVRRFASRELGQHAHTAMGDTAALGEVLEGMVRQLKPPPMSGLGAGGHLQELQQLSCPEEEVDRAGRFKLEDGHITFAFGKFQGQPVEVSMGTQRDYLRWMLGADFPPDTKGVAQALLEGRLVHPGGGHE